MSQIILPPYTIQPDPWHIPQVLHPDQHRVMLLQVVPLPRDVGRGLLAVRQPQQDTLPVSRVGLLGLLDHRADDDALGVGDALTQGVLAAGLGPDVDAVVVDALHALVVHVVAVGHLVTLPRAGREG